MAPWCPRTVFRGSSKSPRNYLYWNGKKNVTLDLEKSTRMHLYENIRLSDPFFVYFFLVSHGQISFFSVRPMTDFLKKENCLCTQHHCGWPTGSNNYKNSFVRKKKKISPPKSILKYVPIFNVCIEYVNILQTEMLHKQLYCWTRTTVFNVQKFCDIERFQIFLLEQIFAVDYWFEKNTSICFFRGKIRAECKASGFPRIIYTKWWDRSKAAARSRVRGTFYEQSSERSNAVVGRVAVKYYLSGRLYIDFRGEGGKGGTNAFLNFKV